MEEVKLSLFLDDMMLHAQNPKDSTKKLLELINKFSSVSGHKLSGREIKKKNLLIITSKNKISMNKFNQGNERPLYQNYEILK